MSNKITDFDDISTSSIEEQYKAIVLNTDPSNLGISEDIYNEDKVLLVKENTLFDDKTKEQVLKHKLLKPLDQLLTFNDSVSTATLIDDIESLYHAELKGIAYNFDDTIQCINEIMANTDFDKIITNKLTVFKSHKEDKYNQALQSAFLALMIGINLKLSNSELRDLFYICLFKDLGEIFVDPSLFKKRTITEAEYRAIKVHPVVSHLILRESNTEFTEQVLDGVLKHHERLDGTGYPQNLRGEDINRLERIVAVTDTYCAMSIKGRSPKDIVRILTCESSNFNIAGNRMFAPFDQSIVFLLTEVLITTQSLDYSERQLSDLRTHVKDLFLSATSALTQINDLTGTITELFQKNVINMDSPFGQASQSLSATHNKVLAATGLADAEIYVSQCEAEELTHLRLDIERIGKSMLQTISSLTETFEKIPSENAAIKNLHRKSLEIKSKIFELSRKAESNSIS